MGLMDQGEATLGAVHVASDRMRLVGGLDEVTPPYDLKPGFVRRAQNFELVTEGGYRRIIGYERLDGRAKPSDAIYSTLPLTITGSISNGNTVTGGTSGATGVVVAVVTTASPNYLVITKVTGTWVSGENVLVAAVPQGVTTAGATANGASSALLHAQYRALAADNYRADIGGVPGSGQILGVVEFNDIVYAWRNNAGGTAAAIYKSSGSGWTAVALSEEISFSNANTSVGDADVLTQGAVTATIQRVVVQTGTLASGVNTGRLIITARAGGNYGAGAATSTGGGALTLSAIQTAITLAPSGSYEFIVENFTGSADTKRVYGVDGVNRGFEFDGTVFVPIATGMTVDTPAHLAFHKNQLFFAFRGSAQHSAPGQPYVWSVIVGAGELGVGDTITAFSPQPGSADGGALAIFTRNRLLILYGSGVSTWNLVTYRSELGAFAKTVQDVGYSMYLDDRGITNLMTTANYGNFQSNTVSDLIRDRLNAAKLLTTTSCISRDRSQYRLFFSNNGALYVTIKAGKVIGIMPMLFPIIVRCIWSGERLNGSEAIYFGSDSNGYVFQMEKGTSFDGAAIEALFSLAYNFQGSPRNNKRYRTVNVEVSGNGYASFMLGYSLGYNSTEIPQPADTGVVTPFSAVFWDAFTWDAFIWDGTTLGPSPLDLDGEAENISFALSSSATYYEAFIITSMLLHYSQRGRLRQ